MKKQEMKEDAWKEYDTTCCRHCLYRVLQLRSKVNKFATTACALRLSSHKFTKNIHFTCVIILWHEISQAFGAVELNYCVFWVIKRRDVVWNRSFETTYRSHYQGSRCPSSWTTWSLKMGKTKHRESTENEKITLSLGHQSFKRIRKKCTFLYTADLLNVTVIN